jgi:hypothetical protein
MQGRIRMIAIGLGGTAVDVMSGMGWGIKVSPN